MEPAHLESLKLWLKQYVDTFLTGNLKKDMNIQFKLNHSYCVMDNSVMIAASQELNPNDVRIAEAIGLLHDIGRFPQFSTYRTFRDEISEDHAELGLNVLNTYGLLNNLPGTERDIIQTAIRYHNKYNLPESLPTGYLMFSKIIRDADKLDILEQLIRFYEVPQEYENEAFEDFPKKEDCTPELVRRILDGKGVSYMDAKTTGDIKLMRMSWVRDINYKITLKIIKEKRYLERIAAKLPQTEDIRTVYTYLSNYLDSRLA